MMYMLMKFKSEACLMSIQMCGRFLKGFATVVQGKSAVCGMICFFDLFLNTCKSVLYAFYYSALNVRNILRFMWAVSVFGCSSLSP